ncbi:hypothetical protein G9A89_010754 [Geosiphon pyriformis]|nr:hypothetical protein G9A89_010754 [Geosiphon pyriformis]
MKRMKVKLTIWKTRKKRERYPQESVKEKNPTVVISNPIKTTKTGLLDMQTKIMLRMEATMRLVILLPIA